MIGTDCRAVEAPNGPDMLRSVLATTPSPSRAPRSGTGPASPAGELIGIDERALVLQPRLQVVGPRRFHDRREKPAMSRFLAASEYRDLKPQKPPRP